MPLPDTKMDLPGQPPSGGSRRAPWVALALCLAPHAQPAAQQGDAPGLGSEELAEVDRMRRRGGVRDALEELDAVLEEVPGDARSRIVRSRCRFERCDFGGAVLDAERAFREVSTREPGPSVPADRELLAEAARTLAWIQVELGRADEAVSTLERAGGALVPAVDTRDAWALGRTRLAAGQRAQAMELLRLGAEAPGPRTWRGLLARARCQRALGFFRRAARSLVEADVAARGDDGTEPDVLVELGRLYFEVYGEVESALSKAHSPAKQFEEALTLHKGHEGARLGLFELYRFNWRLSRRSPPEILREVLALRPDSIRGLLASVSADIDDGRLKFARQALARLDGLAPARRDVRAEGAALAWIDHRREEALSGIEELVGEDPGDSVPERVVGRHLNELYRFGEARGFLARAVERDPGDWEAWTQYARALSNTGDEDGAREAFDRAEEAAQGRENVWRRNTSRVLAKMAGEYVEHRAGDHTFLWSPDAADVLAEYLVPFYREERDLLARRYGHTPPPVRIEVFRRWGDFSVRSTGFEGFSALGVCFGPVVTAVSPLAELRGQFSWARTAYHEYTHVIHLSLSHNRCPRWITEGLATWEEEERNPAWSRNMRRELKNAHANRALLPIRELNRAFRGPRILFAYYQGGLLCRMLIDEFGFSPAIRLLLAFDRGLDLDGAFDEVYGLTPEEVDRRFLAFVEARVAPLRIEPAWEPQLVLRKRLALGREPPPAERGEKALGAWAEDWCTVAWGFLQQRKRVDAEEALRVVGGVGELPARGHFLRGELALAAGDHGAARAALERGLELGGEDYRARMSLGELAILRGEEERAEAHFLAAERDFPGLDGAFAPAELRLAELYAARGETAKEMEARLRWLDFHAGEFSMRLAVAGWLDEQGRFEESVRLYAQANEVDPFRRELHRRWGWALLRVGRHGEALREFDVALRVPPELDLDLGPPPDDPGALAPWEGARVAWEAWRAELLAGKSRALLELGRGDEARPLAEEALGLDPDQGVAREVLELLGG